MNKSRSKVHPNHKTQYRVRNWAAYDRALRQRGDITVWLTPAAIPTWTPLSTGHRGGQRQYSDIAIEAALTLRMVFGLPWRQTEGLLSSVLGLMGLALVVPDHTTLSRRTAGLDVQLDKRAADEPLHLVIDATGVGVVGEGEWAAAKWGQRGRRGWRKLHVAVNDDGFIVAAELTDKATADATALPGQLDQVVAPIARLIADGAYDHRSVYRALHDRGVHAIVPHSRAAVVSGEPTLAARDAHLEHIDWMGQRQWRVDVGHHQQARAENTFFRYKAAFGGRMKARNEGAQRNDALTGCNLLNQFAQLGMPKSERISA